MENKGKWYPGKVWVYCQGKQLLWCGVIVAICDEK